MDRRLSPAPPWAGASWNCSVHILLIHQAFAALGEPGGTRHHELARWLARRGHRVLLKGQPVDGTGAREEARALLTEVLARTPVPGD